MLAALMCMPFLMSSECGSDKEESLIDSDKVYNPDASGAILSNTDILVTIDSDFKPSESYIKKTWRGEYEGWDENQKKNTTISRELKLNPNGTYTNVIAGKMVDSDKNKFFKFESEGGTYTYNPSTGVVRYTVEYDSVLDYKTQNYDVYDQKKYYSKKEKSYTEKADFSDSNFGVRRWVTMDMYLQSLTNKTINIAFSMDPAKESDTPK